jgi:hypothetical protein
MKTSAAGGVAALAAGILVALAFLLGGGRASATTGYPWPIKPFDRQHPIRGAFGDPRTFAIDQPFGVTAPDDGGAYSFHTGVDIAARPGTPVYPVVSGRVWKVVKGGIVIVCSHARSFEYWHLRGNPKVVRGQQVVAEQTVLGWIRRPFDHVHLGETDGHRQWNPLARGHLEPYADHTTPRAIALDFSNGRSPDLTQGGVLGGNDEIAIEAVDPAAMLVPGPFAGLPQTPALVQWRLQSARGWSRWHLAADVRKTLPPRSFWRVYAVGTYQNVPVFDRRLDKGLPGRYLFRVSLGPRRLSPGNYEFEARVADIRGNSSTTTWPIEIPSN